MHASRGDRFFDKPGPWVDLGLTLPVFLLYHLGVVFLHVRNASDIVTGQLLELAEGNRPMYLLITAAIGVVFAGVFGALGRGQTFKPAKLVQIAIEGAVYATAMGLGTSYVIGRIFAGAGIAGAKDPFTGFIMSLGAGFYEELTFRVLLFGLGAKALVWYFARQKVSVVQVEQPGAKRLGPRAIAVMIVWAFVVAGIFSSVHYLGSYGDAFDLRSFAARGILGLALCLIYVTRGFAAAVWTHAIYDVWVLVLSPLGA